MLEPFFCADFLLYFPTLFLSDKFNFINLWKIVTIDIEKLL